MNRTDRAPVDPYTARARQIAAKVAIMNVKRKLREIEASVERKVEERGANS